MKTYIIHHSRDLDGWSSAAIIKKHRPEGIFIPYDYKQPMDKIYAIEPFSEVFIVDVSLDKMKFMDELAQNTKLIWIDHHISAIKKYEEYGKIDFADCVLDTNYAATELTWKYFNDGLGNSIPETIRLLGRYDIWDKSNKIFDWDRKIFPFQYGMRLICNSAETFPMHLLSDGMGKQIDHIIQNGITTLKYQVLMNKKAVSNVFELEFEGYKIIALNTTEFNAHVFDSVWDDNKYDIMMPFKFNGTFWNVGMYATNKHVDCSELARNHGGGGHHSASGFQCTTKKMIDLGFI